MFDRRRWYRFLGFEIAYLVALLAITQFASMRGASVAARGDPGIAAADSALAVLVRTVDMQADPIDSRVRTLVERRQVLIAERKEQLAFWPRVRWICLVAFGVGAILAMASIVQRLAGSTFGAARRTAPRNAGSSADQD